MSNKRSHPLISIKASFQSIEIFFGKDYGRLKWNRKWWGSFRWSKQWFGNGRWWKSNIWRWWWNWFRKFKIRWWFYEEKLVYFQVWNDLVFNSSSFNGKGFFEWHYPKIWSYKYYWKHFICWRCVYVFYTASDPGKSFDLFKFGACSQKHFQGRDRRNNNHRIESIQWTFTTCWFIRKVEDRSEMLMEKKSIRISNIQSHYVKNSFSEHYFLS